MTEDEIFKKLVVANKFISETDCMVLMNTLDKLRMGGGHKTMLELALEKKKITSEQAKRLEKAIKYNVIRQNDRKAVKLLIEDGVITQEQYSRFEEMQSSTYKETRRIISALDLMAEKQLLAKEEVTTYKNKAKNIDKKASSIMLGLPEEITKKGPPDILQVGAFTVKYRTESMDFKGSPVYMSVITASGSIDSHTAPTFDKMCRAVFDLAGDRGRFVVMDLSDVTYMSSAGIGSVIGWKKEAQERGGDIKFIGIQKDVIKVFEMLGVKDSLHIYSSTNDAFWAFIKTYI